jgi:hypothetical protein
MTTKIELSRLFNNPTWIKIQEMIANGKAVAKERGTVHPTWEAIKLFPGKENLLFDKDYYIARKRYLLALDFEDSMSLSHADLYDRMMYLGELDTLQKEYADKLEAEERGESKEKPNEEFKKKYKNKSPYLPNQRYRRDGD